VLTDLLLAVVPTCPRSFALNAIAVNGVPITDYRFEPDHVQAYVRQRLQLPLPQPLPPGQQVTVEIDFSLILPVVENFRNQDSLCSQIYGYTAAQINLVDWYPFIVPYLPGRGWILNNPWYYGEHLTYEASDFDVIVTFTDGLSPVIAASGEEIESGSPNTRRFRLEAGRTFALSFALDFRVVSTVVDGVTVSSYYFAPYEVPARAVLDATAQALQIYSQRFGPYPHKTLTVVQGDFNDGMEFSAFYFHSKGIYNNYDGTLRNHLIAVSVHETAHQWWFEQVGNNQALEPWLDESLATFSEIVYYETVQPEVLGEWWWFYRFDRYQPSNQVDVRIYEGDGQRPYWNKVYLNGARFLQDLRLRLGEPVFFAFLQDYLSQMRGRIATSQDFFRILRRHTDADLSDLISQYFQNSY